MFDSAQHTYIVNDYNTTVTTQKYIRAVHLLIRMPKVHKSHIVIENPFHK